MDLSQARWRKSSFSNGNSGGEGCVEIAFLPDGQVALRDTKNRVLVPNVYPGADWSAFLASIRTGELPH